LFNQGQHIVNLSADPLIRRAAIDIAEGFAQYNEQFRAVTQRAYQHFLDKDWSKAQSDLVERLGLYDRYVASVAGSLESLLDAGAGDRVVWSKIKLAHAQDIESLLDQELNKTFFNTLTRRFFKTRGVDPAIEFIALDIEPTDRITHPVARKSFAINDHLARSIEHLLSDFSFADFYADIGRCAAHVTTHLRQQAALWGEESITAIEMLETVFYRERRAYLVGRFFTESRFVPIVIVLINDERGIVVDAVLTQRQHLAQLFSFTRSYFMADFATVGDAVVFLRTLLPGKPVDEIYSVLGRVKQGKTERYRHFIRHLNASSDNFVHADGERGMVMLVFTLPSYPLVFKLIRDRFAFPKNMAREEVMEKYNLVFKRDRVGRLVDAQEFRYLRFPAARFEPSLLAELQENCALSVQHDGSDLVIKHCYIERRLRPLNLYCRESAKEDAIPAILDYGQAIKDLARSNIFPGDLLLKNFGMTRHGRAVFYDYDELCLVNECHFRTLPSARDNDEEMHHGAWYHVSDNDVFPEQFVEFLGLSVELKSALLERHGEIFQVAWWHDVQARLARGEWADQAPYPREYRLAQNP
jgi:isocitrate dehydrogenase kinase/phosphatase